MTKRFVNIRAAISRCFSFLIRNRNAFLFLTIVSIVVKLIVSAYAPASSDMVDIVKQALSDDPRAQGIPWIILNRQIVDFWASIPNVASKPEIWWSTPPFAMPLDLQLLAVLIRLPALLCDLVIALTLYFIALKIKNSTELARLATLAWLLNPYATFAIEMLALPDVAVSMLVALTALLLLQERTRFAGLVFAGGIALKLYPVFLLPCLLLYEERVKRRLRSQWFTTCFALLGLTAYLGWLMQDGYSLNPLLQYSPVTQSVSALFEYARAAFTLVPQVKISYFAVVLVLFYFAVWFVGARSKPSIVSLIPPVLLFYFAFTDPYPQYVLWVLPFLTLDVVIFARKRLVLLTAFLALAFGWGFLAFAAYSTPSGYSLFLIQLMGGVEPLPWYSQAMQELLFSQTFSVLVTPWFRASLSATCLVYALAIIRGWLQRNVDAKFS